MVLLLARSFFNLWSGSSSEVAVIPYSTFLEQVRADNVAKVHIVADTITGTLPNGLLPHLNDVPV